MALSQDLELDVGPALAGVDRIEQALARMAANAAAQLEGALESIGAVSVQVDADTTRIPGEVSGAVDAADSNVAVTGDASEVTGSIDGAVDAADTDVQITADTKQARDEVGRFTSDAENKFDGLKKKLIGALSAATIGQGLRVAIDAASDLEESTSKVEVVFGDAADEVLRFGDTSATSVGLASQQALEAAGTFGNLFNSLGTTREEAARLAPEVVQLGADLASFNNLGVEDTLDKLRSGLVGEIEPLRQLGISFDAAAVEAKALELGLVGVGEELTEGAKLQARWALILEQSGNAQGDFARTSDGLANTLRIARAELLDAAAVAGQEMVPAVKDLVDGVIDLTPELTNIAVRIAELAAGALPALSAGLDLGVSTASVFAETLVALAPLLEIVASVIQAIPAPLLQVATVGLTAATTISRIQRAVQGLTTTMTVANPAVAAVAATIGVLATVMGNSAASAREHQAAIEGNTRALEGAEAAGKSTTDVFRDLISDQLLSGTDSLSRKLLEAGFTVEDFEAAVGDAAEQERLWNEIRDAGVDLSFKEEAQLYSTVGALAESAEARLRAGVAAGDFNQRLVDEAIVLNGAVNGQVSYAAALEHVTVRQRELDEATAVALAAFSEVPGRLDMVSTSLGSTEGAWVRLTQAVIEQGPAAVGDIEETAARLGVEVDDVETFVDELTGALGEFVGTVLDEVPTAVDAITGIGDTLEEETDPERIIANLEEQATAIQNFERNVSILLGLGFDNLAQIAIQRGPEFTNALVSQLEEGTAEEALLLERKFENYESHVASLESTARTEWAPLLHGSTLEMAEQATSGFDAGIDLSDPMNVAVSEILTVVGNAIPPLRSESDRLASVIPGSLIGIRTSARSEAEAVGREIPAGIQSGIQAAAQAVVQSAINVVSNAVAAARRQAGIASPSTVFADEIGRPIAQGIAVGMDDGSREVLAEARRIVDNAAGAAAAEAGGVAGGGGLSIGAIQVRIDGAPNPEQAFAAGTAAGEGIRESLMAAGVAFDVRTTAVGGR